MKAIEKVLEDPILLRLFRIPSDLWPGLWKSYKYIPVESNKHEYKKTGYGEGGYKHPDFMGRFDFSWDGITPPKLLEYNADTPSMLLESGQVQAEWFKDR